jgi:predicted metal-dependent hydrolase
MVAEDLFNKGRQLVSGIWRRDAGLGVLEELR